MALEMERGLILLMMEVNMKEIGKMVREKEKESIIIIMVINMMESGKITK